MKRINQKALVSSAVACLLLIVILGAFFVLKDTKKEMPAINTKANIEVPKAPDQVNKTEEKPAGNSPVAQPKESGKIGYQKAPEKQDAASSVVTAKEPLLIQRYADMFLWNDSLFYETIGNCSKEGCDNPYNIVSSYNFNSDQKKILLDESLNQNTRSTPFNEGRFQKVDDNTLYYFVGTYMSVGRAYYIDSPNGNRLERIDANIKNPKIEKVGETYYLEGGFGDGCGSERDIYLFDEKNKKVIRNLVSTEILCGNGEYVVGVVQDGVYVERSESKNQIPSQVQLKELYKIGNQNPEQKKTLIREDQIPSPIVRSFYEKESGLIYYVGLQSAHVFDLKNAKFITNIYYPEELASFLLKGEPVGSPGGNDLVRLDNTTKKVTLFTDNKLYIYDLSLDGKEPVIINYSEGTKHYWSFLDEDYGDYKTNLIFKDVPEADRIAILGKDDILAYNTNTGELEKTIDLPKAAGEEEYYALDAGDKEGPDICVELEARKPYGSHGDHVREPIGDYEVNLVSGDVKKLYDRSGCYKRTEPAKSDSEKAREVIKEQVKSQFDRDIVFTD